MARNPLLGNLVAINNQGGVSTTYGKILVPVDGSVPSSCGLNEAIKIAKSQGSELCLVHIVTEFPLDFNYSSCFDGAFPIDILVEWGRAVLNDAETTAKREGVKAETRPIKSIGGAAAQQILAQARQWQADLIIMGTHGRRGLARLAMGSDAEQVVRAATVPVMLVRSTEKQVTMTRQVTFIEAPASLPGAVMHRLR